ncbi:MAG: methyltransferase family protein [Alphaproteobacteria bacterium]
MIIMASLAIVFFAFSRFRAAGTSVHVHHPTTAIITNGIYRYSRNPIYLALTLLVAGIGVAVDGIWVIAMLAPTLIVMHYGVIAREERYLEAKFGEVYLAYKRSVRRWI